MFFHPLNLHLLFTIFNLHFLKFEIVSYHDIISFVIDNNKSYSFNILIFFIKYKQSVKSKGEASVIFLPDYN